MSRHSDPHKSLQTVIDALSAEGLDATIVKHSQLEWHGQVELDDGRYAEIVPEGVSDELVTMFMQRGDGGQDSYIAGSDIYLSRGDEIDPYVEQLKADITQRGYEIARTRPTLDDATPTREEMLDAVTEQARTIDAPRGHDF